MQTYTADIECRNSVANGFHCSASDSITFSHLGGVMSADRAARVLNDAKLVVKKCWKCFAQNWKIKRYTPISYRASAEATRG